MSSIRIEEEKQKIISEINGMIKSSVGLRFKVVSDMELALDQISSKYNHNDITNLMNTMLSLGRFRASIYGKNPNTDVIYFNISPQDFKSASNIVVPSYKEAPIKIVDFDFNDVNISAFSDLYLTRYKNADPNNAVLVNYADDNEAYSIPLLVNKRIIANEYNPTLQYIHGQSVKYKDTYYYCLEDTTGGFNKDNWLEYNGEIIKGSNVYTNIINSKNIKIYQNNILIAEVIGDRVINVLDFIDEEMSSYNADNGVLVLTFTKLGFDFFVIESTSTKSITTGNQDQYFMTIPEGSKLVNLYLNDELLTEADVTYTIEDGLLLFSLVSERVHNTEIKVDFTVQNEVDVMYPATLYKYYNEDNILDFQVWLLDSNANVKPIITIENNKISSYNSNFVSDVTYTDSMVSFVLKFYKDVSTEYNFIMYNMDIPTKISEFDLKYTQYQINVSDYEYGTKKLTTNIISNTKRPAWQSLFPIRNKITHNIKAVLFVTLTCLENIEGWKFYFYDIPNLVWNPIYSVPDSFFKMPLSEFKSKVVSMSSTSDIYKGITAISNKTNPVANPFYPYIEGGYPPNTVVGTEPFRGGYVGNGYVVNNDLRFKYGIVAKTSGSDSDKLTEDIGTIGGFVNVVPYISRLQYLQRTAFLTAETITNPGVGRLQIDSHGYNIISNSVGDIIPCSWNSFWGSWNFTFKGDVDGFKFIIDSLDVIKNYYGTDSYKNNGEYAGERTIFVNFINDVNIIMVFLQEYHRQIRDQIINKYTDSITYNPQFIDGLKSVLNNAGFPNNISTMLTKTDNIRNQYSNDFYFLVSDFVSKSNSNFVKSLSGFDDINTIYNAISEKRVYYVNL